MPTPPALAAFWPFLRSEGAQEPESHEIANSEAQQTSWLDVLHSSLQNFITKLLARGRFGPKPHFGAFWGVFLRSDGTQEPEGHEIAQISGVDLHSFITRMLA